MSSDKKCEDCGNSPSYVRNQYFHRRNMGDMVQHKIRLCKSCFKEYYAYCDEHGPCEIIYNPYFLNIPRQSENGIFGVYFCLKCLQASLGKIGREKRIEYLRFLSARCDPEVKGILKKVERLHLPRKFARKNPLLGGCLLLAQVRHAVVEAVVVEIASSRVPKTFPETTHQDFSVDIHDFPQ